MKRKQSSPLSLEAFGAAIGLGQLEREMVRQKNRLIDQLKEARLKARLSQAELARRAGTKQPAIARMEGGQVGEVSFDFLIRIGMVLGISLELIPAKKAA